MSGAWDFTLIYDPQDAFDPPSADPYGGYTIFEAMQRQLGLKLVTTTAPQPVMVIDHVDKKPTGQ